MKIGILTLPLEFNYGGVLQAFALQQILKGLGHNVLTIDRHDYKHYASIMHQIKGYAHRLVQRILFRKNVSTRWNPHMSQKEKEIAGENIKRFINEHITLTDFVYSDNLESIDKQYQFDSYVVGSDQVWLRGYCPNSFLDFVKRDGVKKIFYAASCGKSSFMDDAELVKVCRVLSKDFSAISVREECLVERASTVLGTEVNWVLDPTMLLKKNDYLKVIKSQSKVTTPYVFSYVIDYSGYKKQIIDYVCRITNLESVCNVVIKPGINEGVAKPVEEWLDFINNANFIITDSFHGTVFAILFNIPFISVVNTERGGGRFYSLLNLLGLQDRIISSYDKKSIDNLVEKQINFELVNSKIEMLRSHSIDFIKKHLS